MIRVLKVAIITPARNIQAISTVKAAARNTAMQIMISSFMLLAEKKVKNKTYENQNTNKRGQRHPEYPFNLILGDMWFFHCKLVKFLTKKAPHSQPPKVGR